MTQHCTNVGNLTEAVELRYTNGGQAVASFTVAVNERYRDATGAYVDGDTYFLRCTAWGDLAEHIAASCNRGSRVIVTGRHTQRSYEHTDKDTGEVSTRWAHDFRVDEVGASMRWNDVKIIRGERVANGAASAPDTIPDEWAVKDAAAPAASAGK